MKSVFFSGEAYEHYIEWQEEFPEIFEKIKILIKDISRDPFKGLGKPEPLKMNRFLASRNNGEKFRHIVGN